MDETGLQEVPGLFLDEKGCSGQWRFFRRDR